MSRHLRIKLKHFALGFTNSFDMTGKRVEEAIEVEAKPFGYYANRREISKAMKKITSETAKRLSSAK
jgi:hypothetical protein